jgi:hypothetical protein
MTVRTRMPTEEDMIATNTRLPVQLHKQLAQAAQESCRALNGEIIFRLRQSLRAESNERSPAEQSAV